MTKTLVLHPFNTKEVDAYDQEQRLKEACGLARAINLDVMNAQLIQLRQYKAATYLGKGKIADIGNGIMDQGIDLVIMDCALSPIQQRNLENAWQCKVIDRTALILEIFGDRAQTKEGMLQVELAALEYQKSRLVRSWTHLERQRGALGFVGGPGETQIEIDRRLINDRIAKIKKKLHTVKKTRGLHRTSRKKVPYPIVALVGYTNAGKSTLFNRLTGAKVFAEDLLFATLDPTMRLVTLPSGHKVIFSDTVGFISDLPTELIAAFRATLEEVVEADIVIHVRDIAVQDSKAQKQDVLAIMESLGVEENNTKPIIEVANKIDLLPQDKSKGLARKSDVAISALNGEGCNQLLTLIDSYLMKDFQRLEFTLDISDGKRVAWLCEHGDNVKKVIKQNVITITATLSHRNITRFQNLD